MKKSVSHQFLGRGKAYMGTYLMVGAFKMNTTQSLRGLAKNRLLLNYGVDASDGNVTPREWLNGGNYAQWDVENKSSIF